ncbi:hypothetical protein VAMP_41n3, partial [Candidatus Vampirococcus lugosii]|nr:hypothetical protein [Candidatus Vampirococcus lugosii]
MINYINLHIITNKLIKDIVQGFLKTKDISLSEISRYSFKNSKGTKDKNIVAGFSKFL